MLDVTRLNELSARDLNRRRHPRCRVARSPGGFAPAGRLQPSSPVPGSAGEAPNLTRPGRRAATGGNVPGKNMRRAKTYTACGKRGVPCIKSDTVCIKCVGRCIKTGGKCRKIVTGGKKKAPGGPGHGGYRRPREIRWPVPTDCEFSGICAVCCAARSCVWRSIACTEVSAWSRSNARACSS